MRGPQDKSNGIVDFAWCDKFNDWIESCNLLEISLTNRKFTWANNQDNLVMSLIDRVFSSTDFDQHFSFATISALPKTPSDHIPILWEEGDDSVLEKLRFKFEKWWLQQDGLVEVVERSWNSIPGSDNLIETWQKKIRKLRKTLRRWSANIEAENKRKKVRLLRDYDVLDKKVEEVMLTSEEKEEMDNMMLELNRLWAMEETKAKQRSRERNIKEGDRNTRYFQTVANQRRRKITIHAMEGPDGVSHNTQDILGIATNY